MSSLDKVVGGRLKLKGKPLPATGAVKKKKKKKGDGGGSGAGAPSALLKLQQKALRDAEAAMREEAERGGAPGIHKSAAVDSDDEENADISNDEGHGAGGKGEDVSKALVLRSGKGSGDEEGGGDGEQGGDRRRGEGSSSAYDPRTPAERRYHEQLAKLEAKRAADFAKKSHRQRIEEFNKSLASMTEHYDIPKVGPG